MNSTQFSSNLPSEVQTDGIPTEGVQTENLHNRGYRNEIDGLRAIAVIAVLLYHIDVTLLPAGYIGVDIFFVISGYVVSRSLFNQPNLPIFSNLAGFYRRRIKRLFPALLTMLIIVGLVYSAVIPGFPMESHNFIYRFGALSAFGLSNLYAIRSNDNYFDGDSVSNPFMNTWSLGVEEQFYLIFPIALFAIFRFSRPAHKLKLLTIFVAITGMLSAVLSARWSAANPVIAYYFMPSRFWELAIGCAIAVTENNKKLFFIGDKLPRRDSKLTSKTKTIINLIHIIALAAISVSLIFSTKANFPFPSALLGTGGCAIIILVNAESIVYHLLRQSVFRYLGKISYSLYLWHWPIIVVVGNLLYLHVIGKIIAAILSIAAGATSYHLIEQRHWWKKIKNESQWSRLFSSKNTILTGALFSISTAAALLTLAKYSDAIYLGRPQAWNQEWGADLGAKVFAGDITAQQCHINGYIDGELSLAGSCFAEALTSKTRSINSPTPTLFVLGDSHAFSSWKMTTSGVKAGLYNVYVKSHDGCALSFPSGNAKNSCQDYWQKVLNLIKKYAKPGDVIYLALFLRNESFDEASAQNVSTIIKTAELADVKVIIEAPLIVHNAQAVNCIDEWFKVQRENCQTSKNEDALKSAPILTILKRLAAENRNVYLWEANQWLCPGAQCSHFDAGRPLFRDDDHLSLYGGQMLAPHFQQFFIAIQKRD